jgi:hypothetical protein
MGDPNGNPNAASPVDDQGNPLPDPDAMQSNPAMMLPPWMWSGQLPPGSMPPKPGMVAPMYDPSANYDPNWAPPSSAAPPAWTQ